ncbi:MAG: hypothetical protein WDA26_06040, partial [Pusillimonas sp.]
ILIHHCFKRIFKINLKSSGILIILKVVQHHLRLGHVRHGTLTYARQPHKRLLLLFIAFHT